MSSAERALHKPFLHKPFPHKPFPHKAFPYKPAPHKPSGCRMRHGRSMLCPTKAILELLRIDPS